MNNQKDSLNDLIHKAAKQAQDGEVRMARRGRSASGAGGAWKMALWITLCAFATGWAILQLLHLLLPVSQGQIRNDLARAAQQARQEIEAARKRDGVLPAAIPNAALANLVSYEVKGTGYRLVVLTVKDRLEVDEAGAQVISERKNAP